MIVNDELPYAYELQYHTTSCRCCGASDHHAAFFAVHRVRERQGNSKRLVPCARPEFNIPVLNNNGGHRYVPYCGRCDIDLSHLPDLPRRENLVDTPGMLREAAPTTPKKTVVTLEDLI